jgi:hypothetical protein
VLLSFLKEDDSRRMLAESWADGPFIRGQTILYSSSPVPPAHTLGGDIFLFRKVQRFVPTSKQTPSRSQYDRTSVPIPKLYLPTYLGTETET